ncbi:hypothetical protein VQ02_17340 [Methylobacterium variabile]|jgi:hypothetical protein|uniref:Depolymerase 2 capsule K5-specific C-terminal domain-containing protein n=1 Tax=Methylobacterium variabile TaxID=298794 RepID=A0A0J6SP78_9HYPH|nr:hypothetical protein [Methylobacterium variabile]KMO35447.1 hypothetical protein VQ02_17340 [Methylobacterium variabile]
MLRLLLLGTCALVSASCAMAEDLPLAINVGAQPNDNTGDPMRIAFIKTMRAVNALHGARGQPNGIATLDSTQRLPTSQLPVGLPGVTVTPSGGDALRPLSSLFADRANVASFQGQDLATKFTKACNSLPSSGGTIYIPGGQYTSDHMLVCDGRRVSVEGDGPGITVITFTSAAAGRAGMSFSSGDQSRQVNVRDLSLLTSVDQVNGNKAIQVIHPSAVNLSVFMGPRISRLEVAGTGNNSAYWGTGISLRNVSSYRVDDISIRGKDIGGATSFPSAAMDAAVELIGDPGRQCSDGMVTGLSVVFARYVGKATGDCEGNHWDRIVALAVDTGLYYPAHNAWPGVWLTNSHINSFRYGVNFEGVVQAQIKGNLLYKWTGSAQDWVGVNLNWHGSLGSSNNIIADNQFIGYAPAGSGQGYAAGGKATAIAVPGGDGNLISRNYSVFNDWVFDFANLGSTNIVSDNVQANTVSGWFRQIGLNTISSNNNPPLAGTDPAFVSFSPGSTTANVGAWFQRIFYTNNPTSPATMTDFTNAEVGRQITIIAQDNNTTIAHNARIKLKGATNMAMVSGASLTLLNIGPFWQEVGRSQ